PTVLDISLRLRNLLREAGLRVAMTREEDVFVGLSARAAFANMMGADVFLSNHINSNSGAPATGLETWIARSAGDRTLRLAQLVQREIVSAWMLADRGVKRADFVVLRETTMPAALAELGFINNCSRDAMLLADPTRREQIAQAEARALLEWLGHSPPSARGILQGVIYEDRGAGPADMSVRIGGATIRVIEVGAMTTSREPDGYWRLELAPGHYTVQASAHGHRMGSRNCTVMGGMESWCSIGLVREEALDSGMRDGATSDEDAMVVG
ncbi:MAG: N-acetylmuramoyl-L-alanine amidase, partial [Sandaracinaceae bacterium]|nr:N-acetylmuramoyl-L-alanine amidase [Sandaracinaceae bacterium]